MSYAINYDVSNVFNEDGVDRYENTTWNYLSSDDSFLASTENFNYWYNNYYIIDEDDEIIDISDEAIDNFRESEAYYDLQDSYYPIYNYIHLLQNRPTDEDIKKINDNAGNVVIIYIEELDSYFISLTGCGMDMSDSIAYAYMVIDKEIPKSLIPRECYTIGKNGAKELMEFLDEDNH